MNYWEMLETQDPPSRVRLKEILKQKGIGGRLDCIIR